MGKRAAGRKASTFQSFNVSVDNRAIIISLAIVLLISAISLIVYLWPKITSQSETDKKAQEQGLTSKTAIAKAYNKGDYKNVIPNLKKYLSSNKDDLKMREMLASSYLLTGKSEQSLKEYQTILKSKPNDAETLYKTGILLQRTGNQNEAITYLSRAARSAPNIILFHAELARASTKAKYYTNAMDEWKAVLKLLPPADKARATVLAEMANLYIMQNDYVQAQGIIATGLALDPNNEVLRALESKTSGQTQTTPGQPALTTPDLPGVWSGEN